MNSFPAQASWLWDAPSGRFAGTGGIPVSDRGFRYGMNLFETLRIHRSRPIFLGEHLERLRLGTRLAGFGGEAIPGAEIIAFLNSGIFPDGIVRLIVTAGDGSPDAPIESPRCLITSEARDPLAPAVYLAGYRLQVCAEPFHPLFGGMKTGNYWPNIAAFRAAIGSGANECLLFNHAGNLVSAAMANLFVRSGERIITPALDCGARPGVVRAWVQGRRSVEEARLTLDDLRSADEIFLTSSRIGIMPASALESAPIPSRSVATALREEYEEELEQMTASRRSIHESQR